MIYHNNEVFFTSKLNPLIETYSFAGGSYTIKQFKVTDGQDPKNHIAIGQKREFSPDGKIFFELGRKGSKEVAAWFNERIPADHTTFNHDAGKLNFAFIGTLELIYTHTTVDMEEEKITFTFEGVALAQGHAGVENNWWFGGQNCRYFQTPNLLNCEQVLCVGSADGALAGTAIMTAARGRAMGNISNKVNEVEVSPVMIW